MDRSPTRGRCMTCRARRVHNASRVSSPHVQSTFLISCRRHRWRSRRPDGGRECSRKPGVGHRLRPHAVVRPQIADGRARRAQSHPQRGPGAISRSASARRCRICAPPSRRSRRPPCARWSEGLGQDTFVGSSGRVFPRAFKASPLLARVAAPPRRRGRDIRAASSVAGVG